MSRAARVLTLAAVPLLATAVVAVTADGSSALRRDTVFEVLSPVDGAQVTADFELVWRPGLHTGSFAVVVDGAPPAAGERAVPGPAAVLTDGTRLALTLMPRTGGSPSARHWHEIVIVPVDDEGRRVGEQQAIVHVRGGHE